VGWRGCGRVFPTEAGIEHGNIFKKVAWAKGFALVVATANVGRLLPLQEEFCNYATIVSSTTIEPIMASIICAAYDIASGAVALKHAPQFLHAIVLRRVVARSTFATISGLPACAVGIAVKNLMGGCVVVAITRERYVGRHSGIFGSMKVNDRDTHRRRQVEASMKRAELRCNCSEAV